MIENIPVLILLFVLSIIDIYKREVPHWGCLSLLIYSFFTIAKLTESLFWGLYASIGLFVIYLATGGGLGGGDVKLLAVLGFNLGSLFPAYLGLLSLTTSLGFLLGVLYYRKLKVSLPLVPLMFLAYLLRCSLLDGA